MFLDDQNLYSDAQALTATAASTDLIDHGADRNLGIGEPMVVEILLDVAADNTTTDETYSVALQTDDNASFSSATTVGSVTIVAGAVAGTRYHIPLPPNSVLERYSRLNYTLGGTTPTVTVTAALLPYSFVQNNVVYADGITIS
jgi:hypothetical protein